MPRLLRITTVPISLHLLLQGQFQYMREHGFEVITMSADGKEVADVTRDGIQHIVVPFTRKISLLHDIKCLWLLVRQLRRIRPDIVHTHTPKAGLLGMVAAWICRVPVRLHTVAGLPLMEASGLRRWMLNLAERITYSCAHQVYPNSFGLKTFIERNFAIDNQKLKMIGSGSSNGIDTLVFSRSAELERAAKEVRARRQIEDGDFVFCFVGRIVRDKGIVELVKAFQSVSNDHAPRRLFLLLVGHFEDDLDPLPPDVVVFLREDERVILAGFQNDIRPWLIASDVFAFPSYREGFPNVVMQASLLQIPCIVSDINGCNEIVKDDSTGVIVPVKNVAALAGAMNALIHDEEKRKRFATAARVFVGDNFKREVIWEGLRKEYERMMRLKRVEFLPQRLKEHEGSPRGGH